jgi:hypothetical protein
VISQTHISGWLLLIHSLPPKPNYFRVKVGRRLQRVGAVALKNSVYLLPSGEQQREDFQWILREIVEDGGEAFLSEARFIDGLSDTQVVELFQAARDEDYASLIQDAQTLLNGLAIGSEDDLVARAESELERIRRRVAEIAAIDYFSAPGRDRVESLISQIVERLSPETSAEKEASQRRFSAEELRNRVWVTRQGVKIDRMASAWLIRRFIDPDALFKFVPATGYVPAAGEIRFDMYEAELTHEGDRCTFEVLVGYFCPGDAALQALAEIIHDIDLKDDKFARPEAKGLDLVISSIAVPERDDESRLGRSAILFDDLYQHLRRKLG